MAQTSQPEESLYECLDAARAEIRLLVLPDGDVENGNISARFRTVSLNDTPEFYALSYVWGDPTPTQKILVNGSEVLITSNVERIIRVLLSHEDGLVSLRGKAIWIDALCINQQDRTEKEHQIPLMGQIYRQATRVLMWLGEAEGNADWAMTRMKDPEFYAAALTLKERKRYPTTDEIKLQITMDRDLEQRMYWTRVWIMQEVVLSTADPLVLCGRHSVPWSHYVNLLECLPGDRGSYPEISKEWKQIRNSIPRPDVVRTSLAHRTYREAYIDKGQKEMTLAAVLTGVSALGATNPSDFVFGCLGTLRPEDACLITPSYGRSVAEVFQEAFRLLWLSDPNPLFAFRGLSFHRLPNSPEGLASWAPDLSNQKSPLFNADRVGSSLQGGSRSGEEVWKSSFPLRPTFSNDVLQLDAIEFDAIQKVENIDFNYGWKPRFKYDVSHEQMIAPLKAAEAMLKEGQQRHIADGDRVIGFRDIKDLEPIWKTMSHWSDELTGLPEAQDSDVGPTDDNSSVERERMLLWEVLMQRKPIPEAWRGTFSEKVKNDERMLKAAVLNRVMHAVRKKSHESRFFLTKQGFAGVATRYVEQEDLIAFADGMSCPIVLRPCNGGYQIKGFAYVSGLMTWEVLGECLQRSRLEPKTFHIY